MQGYGTIVLIVVIMALSCSRMGGSQSLILSGQLILLRAHSKPHMVVGPVGKIKEAEDNLLYSSL